MRMSRPIIGLVLGFMIVALPVPHAGAETTVSPTTLASMFPGTFAVRVQGVSAQFVASSSGRLSGESIIGSDTGRWSVKGGKLCIMLREWFEGQTRCAPVVREGSWYRAQSVRFRKI